MANLLDSTLVYIQTTDEVDAFLGDAANLVSTEILHLKLPHFQARRVLGAQNFPNLTELVLHVVDVIRGPDTNLVDFLPEVFPQLKSLTIECEVLLNLLPDEQYVAPWKNLTSLHIRLLMPMDMALKTLMNCPNLEEGTFYIQPGLPSFDMQLDQPQVKCNKLSVLHLELGGFEANDCQYFFEHVELPELVNFTIGNRARPWFHRPGFSALTQGSPLISSLTITEMLPANPETEFQSALDQLPMLKTFNPGTMVPLSKKLLEYLRERSITSA